MANGLHFVRNWLPAVSLVAAEDLQLQRRFQVLAAPAQHALQSEAPLARLGEKLAQKTWATHFHPGNIRRDSTGTGQLAHVAQCPHQRQVATQGALF